MGQWLRLWLRGLLSDVVCHQSYYHAMEVFAAAEITTLRSFHYTSQSCVAAIFTPPTRKKYEFFYLENCFLGLFSGVGREKMENEDLSKGWRKSLLTSLIWSLSDENRVSSITLWFQHSFTVFEARSCFFKNRCQLEISQCGRRWTQSVIVFAKWSTW